MFRPDFVSLTFEVECDKCSTKELIRRTLNDKEPVMFECTSCHSSLAIMYCKDGWGGHPNPGLRIGHPVNPAVAG